MLVGLKSFVISWTSGLYGLKFAKLSAPAVIFLLNFHIIGQFCYSAQARPPPRKKEKEEEERR
jgi:hypothetical protein